MKNEDMIGKKFSKLTVLEYLGESKFKCKCECGNYSKTRKRNLINNLTQSCGCVQKEKTVEACTKHGLSKHPLYKTWHNIRSRCKNPNATKYEIYGGKGIKICNEWDCDFVSFYEWSIRNGYEKGLTIDRIYGNGNYEPNNCRWVNYRVQNNNLSSNHNIEFNGKSMSIYAWAREIGIKEKTLSERIRRGWSIERALTTGKINIENFGEYNKKFKATKGGD